MEDQQITFSLLAYLKKRKKEANEKRSKNASKLFVYCSQQTHSNVFCLKAILAQFTLRDETILLYQ